MSELKNELLDILNNKLLTPVFQPIVSVNQKEIVGYEALIRGPANSPLHSPLDLFMTAEKHDLHTRLEFACRAATIQCFADLNSTAKLFLNVSPSVLLDAEFKKGETLKIIKESGLSPESIIIELTEHQPIDDFQIMLEAVAHYRNMGFEIALDDLGTGYSGLRLWSELHPEYVKIDKHFIRGLNKNTVKYNFVKSFQNMATNMHCRVIAEGIETKEEFDAIVQIGITHAQGFYFAYPKSYLLNAINEELFVNSKPQANYHGLINSSKVEAISQKITPIDAETPIYKVLQLFQQNDAVSVLPVVSHGLAIGLIARDKFLSKLFSSRYGIELHGKQPIKIFSRP